MKTELEIKMEINDGEKPNLPNRRKSTPKIVTFGGRMHDIISEFDKGNSKPFDEILDQLKDEDLDHRKMNKLIVEIGQSAALFQKKHGKIIPCLMGCSWLTAHATIIENWSNAVLSLVIANVVFVQPVFNRLKKFLHYTPSSVLQDDENEEIKSVQYSTVHALIDQILAKIPLAPSVLEKEVKIGFTDLSPQQIDYIDNLLKIAVRHPKLQKGFLEMIFVAVSQWDQKIPKALLMDFEDDEETLGEIEVQSIKLLDKILIRLIKHIDDVTYADDKETRSQNLSKFLREFIKIFETVLLPQPTTRNTQFFLFHLLSMKSTFSDSFVDWLLKRLLMPTGSVSRRLAAASYLCGFLARADYAPNSTIQTTCQILSQFAIEYLQNIPESKQCHNTDRFAPFYIITQALFYLIIFRQSEIGLENLRKLSLQKILFSKLNPLNSCVPGIALKFCDVMKELEICFCHGILEETRQRNLLTRGRDQEINPIEFSFPFDPCLLPELSELLDSSYNHWNNGEDVSDSESESEMDET